MGQVFLLFAAALLAFLSPAAAQSVDLQEAVLAGDVGAVRSFIAGGADLDEQGDLGTALHVAALKDNAVIAAILLHAGADKEAAVEHTGTRPLHVAASYDRPSVAALLLDRGATVDTREASGQTPLLMVSKTGGADVARLLLDHGADVDGRDDHRASPLHYAARRGATSLAVLLLDHHAE